MSIGRELFAFLESGYAAPKSYPFALRRGFRFKLEGQFRTMSRTTEFLDQSDKSQK